MTHYLPELGQMASGAPWAPYGCPEYAAALVEEVLWRAGREYWKREQEGWCRDRDPGIPGLVFRPYRWGDESAPEAALPNLECAGLRLRWYKWPGRGMTVEEEWNPERWVEWFDAARAVVDAARKTRERARSCEEAGNETHVV